MKKQRRSITLVEMIIVMILIATITGALAYNYQGTLNRGKLFKTEQNMDRLRTILMIELSEKPDDMATRVKDPEELKSIIARSGLAPGKGNQLLSDGWGKQFSIDYIPERDNDPFEITSDSYRKYKEQTKRQ